MVINACGFWQKFGDLSGDVIGEIIFGRYLVAFGGAYGSPTRFNLYMEIDQRETFGQSFTAIASSNRSTRHQHSSIYIHIPSSGPH